MNVREAMHDADPARRLRPQEFDEADEQLLQAIVSIPQQPNSISARPAPAQRAWRPLVTTGLVAIVVVVATTLTFRAVPVSTPSPAATPTPTSMADNALEAAVDAKLAAAAAQTNLDPSLPSQTWTDRRQGAQGEMIDLTGKTLYLAASCAGGGTVTIRIDGQLDTTIDCSTSAAIGPINLTAIAASTKKGIGYDITATTGQPKFFAKAVATPSLDVTTTSSVNIDGRTLLTYSASGAGGPQALLHGILSENEAGCITVGRTVLVAPSNAELHADGSLSFGDTTLTPGSRVNFGGATAASIPIGSPCRAATGDYFIIGDYPQPPTN